VGGAHRIPDSHIYIVLISLAGSFICFTCFLI